MIMNLPELSKFIERVNHYFSEQKLELKAELKGMPQKTTAAAVVNENIGFVFKLMPDEKWLKSILVVDKMHLPYQDPACAETMKAAILAVSPKAEPDEMLEKLFAKGEVGKIEGQLEREGILYSGTQSLGFEACLVIG